MQPFYKKQYRLLIEPIKTFSKNLINLKNQSLNHVNIVVNHSLVEQISQNQERQVSMLQALVMFMCQNWVLLKHLKPPESMVKLKNIPLFESPLEIIILVFKSKNPTANYL